MIKNEKNGKFRFSLKNLKKKKSLKIDYEYFQFLAFIIKGVIVQRLPFTARGFKTKGRRCLLKIIGNSVWKSLGRDYFLKVNFVLIKSGQK